MPKSSSVVSSSLAFLLQHVGGQRGTFGLARLGEQSRRRDSPIPPRSGGRRDARRPRSASLRVTEIAAGEASAAGMATTGLAFGRTAMAKGGLGAGVSSSRVAASSKTRIVGWMRQIDREAAQHAQTLRQRATEFIGNLILGIQKRNLVHEVGCPNETASNPVGSEIDGQVRRRDRLLRGDRRKRRSAVAGSPEKPVRCPHVTDARRGDERAAARRECRRWRKRSPLVEAMKPARVVSWR